MPWSSYQRRRPKNALQRVIAFAAKPGNELDAADRRALAALFRAWAGHVNPELAGKVRELTGVALKGMVEVKN